MFFMFVNCEKPIPYFNLIFLFFFLVLEGERHKMGVKRLIYPSFLTEVGNKNYMEVTLGGYSVKNETMSE